jgi:hypothetical protein
VPASRPGRVHEDLAFEPLAPQDVLEDALSQRRATDVSHTDEEDAHSLLFTSGRPLDTNADTGAVRTCVQNAALLQLRAG